MFDASVMWSRGMGIDQHITYRQLRATGLDDADIRAVLRDGRLLKLRRGAYALPDDAGAADRHLRLVRATLDLVDPGNVLSHVSAGVIHGLPIPRDRLDVVTMTRRTSGHANSRTSLRVFDSVLEDDEVTLVDGLPVTGIARTVLDLARTLDYPLAVAVADAALKAGLARAELLAGIGRHPRLHGRRKAHRAAEFADPRAESPAESVSRVQMARYGIPEPEPQFQVIGAGGVVVARTDFGWEDWRLVGEIDGKWKYGELLRPGQRPEDAIMDEKRREELIRESGYWIVRWDWALAMNGPRLAERIRRAMAMQQRLLAS